MAWHRFAAAVSDIAVELGVKQMVGFGAYPFATPHTRPPRLSCTSPSTDVLANVTVPPQLGRRPGRAWPPRSNTRMHARKIPALGIWAQVPHYVAAMAYPAASVALLDGLSEVTGITVAATDLRADIAIQRERIDKSIGDNPDHLAMLRQLEEIYDAAEGEMASDARGTDTARPRDAARATSSPPRSSASSTTRTDSDLPSGRLRRAGTTQTDRSAGRPLRSAVMKIDGSIGFDLHNVPAQRPRRGGRRLRRRVDRGNVARPVPAAAARRRTHRETGARNVDRRRVRPRRR